MPKSTLRQTSQSVNGLFRALGVDAKSLPRTRPLYRRLVTLLEGAIARGDVPAGFRLPPERDLAASLSVSRATVVSAYRELEARGLVRGYVGRGTFVSAKPDTGSAPFAWRGKIAAAALQATDTTVRDLVRAAADPQSDVARRRRAGARLLPDRRLSAGDEPRAGEAGRRRLASRADRRDAAVPRARWRTASAGSRSTSWCWPARSRASICSRAA